MNDAAVEFDPLDPAVQQCPYPHYRSMRNDTPVLELDGAALGRPGERIFAVCRHEDVTRVAVDWRTFSSRFGTPAAKPSEELRARLHDVDATGWPNLSTMLTEDPPSHSRYRRLVSKAFTPKRVRNLGPEIRTTCHDLVSSFDRSSTVDFMSDFAVPLPVRAVAAILQVPDDHQQDFKRWADSSVAAIGRRISDDERVAAQRDIVEQQHYFADQIEQRRIEPRDDFLTDLLNAELTPDDEVEGGPLSVAEMLSIVRQIQVAGSETTTSLLADLMVMLSDRPDEWEKIRADPSRAAIVVEEGLRVASPNQGLFRIVSADTEIAGTTIPAGSTVWIMYGSANRDDRTFVEPDEFRPDRPDLNAHVAFGKGPHYCLGAALARLEATTALEVLAERIDGFTVANRDELRYGASFILRGLESLELDLD